MVYVVFLACSSILKVGRGEMCKKKKSYTTRHGGKIVYVFMTSGRVKGSTQCPFKTCAPPPPASPQTVTERWA